MQSIFEAYEEKYRNRTSCLIQDGIVDPDHYAGILFLLKEAYSREPGRRTWDLCGHLADYGPWKMWHRVAKWTDGLLNTTADHLEPYCKDMEYDRANALLRKIAVVNVKKVDGKPESDGEDLERFAREDADLLRRQIREAKPRIIVCGNTFAYLQTVFGLKKAQYCDNWYYWLELDGLGRVLVLDYYHPAVRYPELMTYYGLVGCYQQALRNL